MTKTIQPRLGTVVTMIVAILFLFLLFSQAGKYSQTGYIVEKAEERLALNKERKKAMLYIGVNDDVALKVKPIEIPLSTMKTTTAAAGSSVNSPAKTALSHNANVSQTEATAQSKSITQSKQKTQYTVRQGDTLFGISQKIYGDGNKWRTILKNNKSLTNPNGLRSGMKLNIPEPTEQNSAYLKWQKSTTKRG